MLLPIIPVATLSAVWSGIDIPSALGDPIEYAMVLGLFSLVVVTLGCYWQVLIEKSGVDLFWYAVLVSIPYIGQYIWLYIVKSENRHSQNDT